MDWRKNIARFSRKCHHPTLMWRGALAREEVCASAGEHEFTPAVSLFISGTVIPNGFRRKATLG
jgi:hypothetical protein